MDKNDIKELRKAIKAKDNCVSWVYGLYVDADNRACWERVQRLSDMEDAERFRHQTIFMKVLSPRLGRDAFPISLLEQQEFLLFLRSLDGRKKEEFSGFRDRLLEEFSHTEPYYAVLARVIYDVPARAGDRRKLEDGTEVYEAVLFSICPASLSKAALGFAGDEVAELERRWQIGNPASGFLYPAFSDRSEDRNLVLIHSGEPEGEQVFKEFFKIDEVTAPVGMKTQKELFASLLSQINVSVETAAEITETVAEKAACEDAFLVEEQEIRKVIEAAGADAENFEEIFEETVGDTPILLTAVAEPYVTVKTDSAEIKVPTERSQLITTRNIDGREYILIPADGAVTVNGVPVGPSVSVKEKESVQ